MPEQLHHKNRFFVPPFPGSIAKLFHPKAPFAKHGKFFPLIAYRDNQPVGRICAYFNREHETRYHDKVGFFGFFDFIDDLEVAKALFAEAQKYLKQMGCIKIRGPYSLTINDECGLLLNNFETIPFVMMPFNPAYYLDIYAGLGLIKVRELFAYYISAATEAPARIEKIAKRVEKSTGIIVRPINMKRLDSELKIIEKLYNESLDRNWGFIPITIEDLQFAAADLKAIVNPEMVMIAEKDGVAVGYALAIPNINELLWKAKDQKGLLRILKFLWLLKTTHPKEGRLTALGVSPEYRNKGLGALFYYDNLIKGRKKYIGGELSWVEENNEELIRAITIMGGEKYKTYGIFETDL